jgi:hypothetical protein
VAFRAIALLPAGVGWVERSETHQRLAGSVPP